MPDTLHRSTPRTRGRHPRTPLAAAVDPILTFDGVTARAPGGKVLLDDVSFAVQRGWLVAVVGPTGAGKTSLARAVTGALAIRTGTILLDGDDLAGDASRRQRIAYVPQDDVLHGSLSLRRTLGYAASLRVPDVDTAERDRRVDAALTELGLEHHADTPVSSLSGGQRKRANIAAELVGQPDVVILDEPTSGLDPGYEKSVLATLRRMADAGRTVITITHSVQVLSRCDRVLFLAAGGRVAYFGPPKGAVSYFGGSDAADVFLALDEDTDQDWKDRFRSHPAYERYVRPVLAVATGAGDRHGAPADRPGCWGHQFRTLVRRHLDLLRSDRRHLALLLLQGPLLGLLLWFVLAPDTLRMIGGQVAPSGETIALFVALSSTWLGASNAIREIVKERHIVRREVDAGLSPSAYVLSKAAVLGALTIAQTTVLAAIACASQHPPAAGAFLPSGRLELAVTGALVGLAATALGLLLSSLVTSPDKALALLPMTLVTELALAGGWASKISTPLVSQLRDVTGAHWGVQAIDATVTSDGHAWLGAFVILVALSVCALGGAVAMVHHQTRPAVNRATLGERAEHTKAIALSAQRPLLGGLAGLCLLVAIGAAVGASGPSHSSPAPQVAAAPAGDPAAPVAPATPAPVATAPATTPPAAPVVVLKPRTTATTVAPPTTEAPAVAVVEPTTTTTYYTPPASTETALPTPGPVTAAAAAPANPWTQWFTLWYQMATLGQG